MSPFPYRPVLSASQVRSVAIAALFGAAVVAAPFVVARAADTTPAPTQQPQTAAPQAGVPAVDSQPESVEQRITDLHMSLKINPDEEKAWNNVAQAMRENASAMEKLIAERTIQAPQTMTAIDDLKSYEKFTQEHANGLKNLIASFETLYNSMPDVQKKNADMVFRSFGHRNNATHG